MAEIQLREAFKAFDKAYFTKKPSQSDFDLFCEKAKEYAEKINKAIEGNKVEENFKLDFRSLLREAFYAKRKDCAIEPVNPIDMAIVKDDTVRVLMEFKRFSNKAEMIRKNDLNRKALHEALTYFFDQFYNKNNRQIRSIIISNGEDFFVFDPKEFTQKSLEKIGKAAASEDLFDNKTDFIYDSFKQVIAKENITFNYSYFNSHDLTKGTVARKVAIYKTLHPDFLLREYSHRDSNQLNNRFYAELLHILGLSETTENGKVLIQPSKNKQGLINETIEQLTTDKGIYNLKEAYEIAFELVINWLNRVLFLKLFESQLVSFNNGDSQYRFLTASKVKNYDALNNLFFKVLGRPISERTGNKLAQIPYLNSSLFEVSEAERKYFSISSLDNDAQTELYKSSNLKNWTEYKKVKKAPTLKYLLDFLESYDFSSVDDGDLVTKNSAEIINPAVLGLIFEKLNGYKEGSFFTPGYITEFMAQLSVEQAVIQKFNKELNIEAESLEEICNCIGSPVYKTTELKRYNQIVDSLKIVDPAVGSGHFLVSVLNYIIYLKSKLGILWDGKKRITEEIEIIDDTLCVYIEDQLFSYKRNDPRTYRLQQALFKEKQKLIENCLFGVDINEKSVTICRLRLWIELLKNAYYLDKDSDVMELLPNIDINIKSGNSLISKFKPTIGKSITKTGETKKVKAVIDQYKLAVNNYKHSGDKKDKQKIWGNIKEIKQSIYRWVQLDLFKKTTEESYLPENAFEWLIEFPEVLDDSGRFTGFDVIIGNPPYIKESDNKNLFIDLKNTNYYQGKMDIWYYFACRSLDLLKDNGYLTFIATNNWITNDGAAVLRKKVLTESTFNFYIDFGDNKIFDSASIQTMIFLLRKVRPTNTYKIQYYKLKKQLTHEKFTELVDMVSNPQNYLEVLQNFITRIDPHNDGYIRFLSEKTEQLLTKISHDCDRLTSDEIFSGVDVLQDKLNKKAAAKLNGLPVGTGIFVITQDEIKKLKLNKLEQKEVLRPYFTSNEISRYGIFRSNSDWLIYTDASFNNPEKIKKYPNIQRHLDSFKDILTSVNKPYGLHRPRIESNFKGEKILSIRKGYLPSFSYSSDDTFVSRAYLIIKTSRFNNLFLTGLLNSRVIAYWLKEKGKIQGQNFQVDKEPLLSIPIKRNKKIEKQIAKEVEKILSRKNKFENATIDVHENKINELVFELYELNNKEKEFINSELADCYDRIENN